MTHANYHKFTATLQKTALCPDTMHFLYIALLSNE